MIKYIYLNIYNIFNNIGNLNNIFGKNNLEIILNLKNKI